MKITGETIALVNKYTRFDPNHPEKTNVAEFSFVSRSHLKEDGTLNDFWTRDGYVMVGTANIEMTLLPKKDITSRAVTALREQKKQVIARAQAEVTRIESEIQNMLAIEYEA